MKTAFTMRKPRFGGVFVSTVAARVYHVYTWFMTKQFNIRLSEHDRHAIALTQIAFVNVLPRDIPGHERMLTASDVIRAAIRSLYYRKADPEFMLTAFHQLHIEPIHQIPKEPFDWVASE